MNKALIACLILGMLMLSACPGGGGDSSDGGSSASGTSGGSSTAQTPPADDNGMGAGGGTAEKTEAELVARGREIYYGTEYSNTGLTCAHCHAGSPDEEQGARLIAHTGYGAVPRGSWKHTSQAELDAKMGKAATILDAANFCVGAPYMAHKEMLIEGEDGAALTAFMVSIADPTAWDAQPFLLDLNRSMPVAGLTPNMENGERIYEHSCEKCHDAGIDGLEDLHGLGDWMNPMQLMAKIRKQKNWYDEYENASYAALPSHDLDRAVAWMLGIDTAWAQDENPCAENPCGGHEDHDEHEEHEDGTFEENAMPHYASDILSDQDVVDVAHFIIENE